jgi:hypothetical protein
MRSGHNISGWWVGWPVLALSGLMAAAAADAGEFGTRCQRAYQSGWLETMDYQYNRCEGFNSRLDDNNTKLFYLNLRFGSGFTTNDGLSSSGGVDTVDIFYVATHGSVSDTDATLALKPVDTFTSSLTWRFGNNSNQVAIFSQYACFTLKIDGKGWARWVNAFKGGLYLATGSHNFLYDGWTTDDTGEDYADNLTHGKTVKWAWFDGNYDHHADQDVAIYASSSGPLGECRVRRDFMTGQNINAFPRFRDSSMNRICASWISEF